MEMADQGADLRDLVAPAGHATGSGMAAWYSRKSMARKAKLDAKLRLYRVTLLLTSNDMYLRVCMLL